MKKDIQDKRIDDILNSIEGMQSASAPDSLFGSIEQQIEATVKRVVPLNVIIAAAASILLLLSVNVYLVLNSSNSETLSKSDMDSVIQYYELEEQRVNINI